MAWSFCSSVGRKWGGEGRQGFLNPVLHYISRLSTSHHLLCKAGTVTELADHTTVPGIAAALGKACFSCTLPPRGQTGEATPGKVATGGEYGWLRGTDSCLGASSVSLWLCVPGTGNTGEFTCLQCEDETTGDVSTWIKAWTVALWVNPMVSPPTQGSVLAHVYEDSSWKCICLVSLSRVNFKCEGFPTTPLG